MRIYTTWIVESKRQRRWGLERDNATGRFAIFDDEAKAWSHARYLKLREPEVEFRHREFVLGIDSGRGRKVEF